MCEACESALTPNKDGKTHIDLSNWLFYANLAHYISSGPFGGTFKHGPTVVMLTSRDTILAIHNEMTNFFGFPYSLKIAT